MTRWRIQFVPSMAAIMGGPWCLLTPRRFTVGYFASLDEAVDWIALHFHSVGWMDEP